jgi:hypothetical protein
VRREPGDGGLTRDQLVAEFDAMVRTTPEKAAEIICRGVEQGRARILVGPDAYLFDALARITPTHYYDVLQALDRRRSRRAAAGEQAAGQAGAGAAQPAGSGR